MSKTFFKSIVRMGDSVRTTFGTILNITGKIDFVEFCNSQNSYKMLPNPKDIVIFVHFDILYKPTKFEGMLWRGDPP
jgi:hypothetical protein